MIGELLCPDCGGVVGATETTEAGPPCKCFLDDRARPSDPDSSVMGGSDTAVDVSSLDTTPKSDAPVAKVCRICGKDVNGHRRVKDHLGYYCMDCAREEEKKEHQGRVRCKVCGKLTMEENIQPYEGTKMCHRCRAERVELQKAEIKRMGFKSARTREELRRIYMMVAAVAVLLLVILYGLIRSMR